MLVINRLSVCFSKANLATNDTNGHELKDNMQKVTWRFYHQCEFVPQGIFSAASSIHLMKSVAGVIMLFLFGAAFA